MPVSLHNALCVHCGLLRPSWLRAHRRHAGLSFHRVCCCGAAADPCASGADLQATAAGIDAGRCTGCLSFLSRHKIHNLNVDGTYSPIAQLTNSGSSCVYEIDFTAGAPYGDWETYSDAGCTTSDDTGTWNTLRLRVEIANNIHITYPSGTIIAASATVLPVDPLGVFLGGSTAEAFTYRRVDDTVNRFLGDALANQQTCGGTQSVSNAGSLTWEFA